MSALWEWASNLSSLDRRETLLHLSFRWQTSSRALAGSADILSAYLDKAADLGKQARGKYHDEYHTYEGIWPSAAHRNMSILAQTILPNFARASNAITLGKMAEAAARPCSLIGRLCVPVCSCAL